MSKKVVKSFYGSHNHVASLIREYISDNNLAPGHFISLAAFELSGGNAVRVIVTHFVREASDPATKMAMYQCVICDNPALAHRDFDPKVTQKLAEVDAMENGAVICQAWTQGYHYKDGTPSCLGWYAITY